MSPIFAVSVSARSNSGGGRMGATIGAADRRRAASSFALAASIATEQANGSVKRNVVPMPTALSTQSAPPFFCAKS